MPTARMLLPILSVLLLISSPARADVDVAFGNGFLWGYSQYQIGGTVHEDSGSTDYHFPISELRFPLDAVMFKTTLSADVGKNWRVSISGETNLSEDTGKMEDSDWGYYSGSPADQLDIYSESDTDMEAWLFDANAAYTFFTSSRQWADPGLGAGRGKPFFSSAVGVGFKYQRYDFDVYDLDQRYPSSPHATHTRVSGLVLTYTAEYQIPYLQLSLDMCPTRDFSFVLNFAYAPVLDFQDEDNHLLRSKVLKADHNWNGSGGFIQLHADYRLPRNWFLQAELEGQYLRSSGRASGYVDGEWAYSIEHKVQSEQYHALVQLGYSF